MADPFVITTSIPLPQLAAAFEAAPDIVREELVPAMFESSLLLEREIRERTPTSGAGTLRDSIGALPVTFDDVSVSGGVGTSLAYALPVELGSKPHFPPVEPLIDWVRRKLGKKPEEAKAIARAIAWKIFHDGTKPAYMFRDGVAATQDQVRDILTAAAGRALDRVLP